ncbi:putative P-loop containing nucleoside triphosphate hydrolase, leucine-rich repeat domain, L [Medicago truncatula]|uniref:Putative P-loop containing nucleoside triphosphate hydrolase, leucine-rich repeat domain, L n=1 Tax=Medicago truncatula TaxID=3880 RepID=A0A396ITL7_MEDTR|nr:putative P-loop containing nucleoside triphosphate hydrolase, leucine-rich repeat domain, L [Medicago truncatula]
MCDCKDALACARDHLLPLARDHLLPFLKEAFNMIRGVPKEIAELKDELERIEVFINDADRRADDVEDKKIKDMIKQLIEASFHMEDVIDDYIFLEEQHAPDPGCAAVATNCVKTMAFRLQIAYKIQNIKSRISEINDTRTEKDHGFYIQSSSDKASTSSATNRNASLFQNLRDAPLYMVEADVVGFDKPRDELIDLLVAGRADRTIVSIFGMGGQGKTTLAKKVFDNPKVVKYFDCRVWITVSRPYNTEKVLRDIMLEFYKQQGEVPPESLHQMDRKSLVDEVRNHFQGKRLYRFVKEDRGRTFEEVAEGYLVELIHRSLVQVVSTSIDGRVKSCRVHDLVHEMILDKFKDLSFCKNIFKGKNWSAGMIRRLSIASNSDNLREDIESSSIRSLLILEPQTSVESFVSRIPRAYRRLKVLALIHMELLNIPNDFGSLNHLKYFASAVIKIRSSRLPKSIGMLVNLETLDLKSPNIQNRTVLNQMNLRDVGFEYCNMPKEICKLKKLRHFIGYQMSLIQLKDGIGGMTSLQTLNEVYLDDDEDEDDNRVVELIEELGKLKQLRELSLVGVRSKYMSAISSSINKMQQLEKLNIRGIRYNTFIDMDLNSPPPKLQRVKLIGYLLKLPEWISKLQYLVKLKVTITKEGNDAMKLLKSMPNLLSLEISGDFSVENTLERLHFEDGWFMNLKNLAIFDFFKLSHILIDEGALGSLRKLTLKAIPELMMLPTGIQHLHKLEVLCLHLMSYELKQSIAPNEGKEHWIFKQVPFVEIIF